MGLLQEQFDEQFEDHGGSRRRKFLVVEPKNSDG